MRRMLRANNCNAFAAWQVIRDEQKKITPPMKPLPAPHIGVYFSMLDAIQMTAQRILIQQDESTTVPEGDLSLEIKFGFDGSGSHAIYNQINNASTNNMIMTMFCPLKMTDSSSKIIFQQPLPNSSLSQRPLCLQMGKESTDTLQSLDTFNSEIDTLKSQGVQVQQVADRSYTVRVIIASHMLDGKAAKLFTGLGGAYCDLCHYSKADCADQTFIQFGFRITRDIDKIINYVEENADEEGNIPRKQNDYATRAGITQKPIATHQVNSLQVLHTLLRTFDHFMQVVVHVKAAVFSWSESSWQSTILDKTKVVTFIKMFYQPIHP